MVRLILIIFFLLLPYFSLADDNVEEQLKYFLQSRVVLGQVYFDTRSTELTKVARQSLDLLASQLKNLDAQTHLFRVEGFSSSEGHISQNVNYSLARAIAVKNYLKKQHKLTIEIYLTGFADGGSAEIGEKSRRVDVAFYLKPVAAMALFDDHGTVDTIAVQ